MYEDNVVAAPVTYVVSYFGENFTNGTSCVVMNATFDLPAEDSDVNIFVTAMNVFGTGGDSEILMDEISELPICIQLNLSTQILYITGMHLTG